MDYYEEEEFEDDVEYIEPEQYDADVEQAAIAMLSQLEAAEHESDAEYWTDFGDFVTNAKAAYGQDFTWSDIAKIQERYDAAPEGGEVDLEGVVRDYTSEDDSVFQLADYMENGVPPDPANPDPAGE